MKKLAYYFFISFVLIVFSIGYCYAENEAKFKLSPTKDPESPSGFYIPKDLKDTFVQLNKILSPELVEEMKNEPEDEMIRYHRTLGMWLRNNWGLWKGSRLSSYFNKMGIHHPDDMSGIIFDSFWRHLNGRPIELKKQIKYYQDYWKKAKKEELN